MKTMFKTTLENAPFGYYVTVTQFGELTTSRVFGRLTNAQRFAKRFQGVNPLVKIWFDGKLTQRYFRGKPVNW